MDNKNTTFFKNIFELTRMYNFQQTNLCDLMLRVLQARMEDQVLLAPRGQQ